MNTTTSRLIHHIALIPALVGAMLLDSPAAPRGQMPNPDFTKGEKIPEGARHDWTLGATGARGWMYSNRLETSEARQIAITRVDKGSPADGVLEVGDVTGPWEVRWENSKKPRKNPNKT